MSAFDAAIATQRVAADPGVSTWLTANAGSGKTRVLTDRVARLLLEGVPPENILCLTFTKAAAGEMQNRLYATLGKWSMAEDHKLAKDLREIGADGVLDDADLRRARRLFAQAIDTPGGLKIQTIHAFAAALLRQFPLEAKVAPAFRELDDLGATDLRRTVLDDMATSAHGAALIGTLLVHLPSGQFAPILAEIARSEPDFEQDLTREDVCNWFGLTPGASAASLCSSLLSPEVFRLIQGVIPVLKAGKSSDQTLAAALAKVRPNPADQRDLAALESAVLTKEGALRARLVTKDVADRLGGDAEALADLAADVLAARDTRLALQAVEATLALHTFARDFLTRYRTRKAAMGVLDFDDLIRKAAALLAGSDAAQWVLYRLDGWIDHILVDEAQDTSPAQWQIVEALCREFTAGEGARPGGRRTLFVVGDPKQSIYGFQGADLAVFAHRRGVFGQAFAAAGLAFREQPLLHSFRSSPLILDLVDRVAQGAKGLGRAEQHLAVREELPGRIEVLPPTEKDPTDEKPKFGETNFRVAAADPAVVLADTLALRIKDMLAREWITHKDGGTISPLAPGDILVLLRKRSRFMVPFIAACKRHGLPVAGADRLTLQDEIAVKDVMALLAFLDLPEDDLALAAVLRSPLFGLNEQQVFTLANRRGDAQTLWSQLRDQAALWPDVVARLSALLNLTDLLRPYDLIETILTRDGGRRALAARLGAECHDALDALLETALDYERLGPPSLTGFLEWFQSEATEVKRPAAQGQGLIRVMSVHGAKGLEAPVVILPDTGVHRDPPEGRLQLLPGRGMTLKALKAATPQIQIAARAEEGAADAEEDERLLYVALTRAQSWLIVAAWNEVKGDGSSWYDRIHAAVSSLSPEHLDGRLVARFGAWPAREPQGAVEAVLADLPALSPDPARQSRVRFRAPSSLVPHTVGAAAPGEEDARARGLFIHHLLEHLPDFDPAERRTLALERAATETGYDAEAAALEALALLDHPLFLVPSLPEVGFAADLPEARNLPVMGRIDRLADMGTHLLVVDYKSDRHVPSRPQDTDRAYLAQMGAYLSAMRAILPEREVRVAILWTSQGRLMELPNEIVMSALGGATTS
jgi:ATP-dependent helicase/nuclease subunit A